MRIRPLYILLILVFILSACGQRAETEATAPPAAQQTDTDTDGIEEGPESGRCGDPAMLADEINLYIWVEYIDPAIKDQFEA